MEIKLEINKGKFFRLIIGFWIFFILNISYAGNQALSTQDQKSTTLSTIHHPSLIPCINLSPSYFILVSLGAAKLAINKTNDVLLAYDIDNRYVENHTTENKKIAAIGVGRHFKVWQKWPMDLGITGYYFSPSTHSGIVHPAYNLKQDFDTLNYKFRSFSFFFLAESRLFLSYKRLNPFFFLGMGLARTHLYNYSETPTDPNLTAAPMLEPFGDHWNNHFAYGLGLGFAYLVKEKARWSIEYRYLNLGDAALGTTPSQSTGQNLDIGPLKMNMLLVSFFI